MTALLEYLDPAILDMVGDFVIIPWLLIQFFQTTKGLHYDSYSMYRPIFKLFCQAVYPGGVTTNHLRDLKSMRIIPLVFV